MCEIHGVVETCLYVTDVQRSATFYGDVLGLRLLGLNERMASFCVGQGQLLLLFQRGGTTQPISTPGGMIPAHDAAGTMHVGLAIAMGDLDSWRARLQVAGITFESEVRWERGGISLYFRDPDRHLVELLTPGVWEVY